MLFSQFDKRLYETVDSISGYNEWSDIYDSNVPDLLDIRLLEEIDYIDWPCIGKAADLGCGTGRTGNWLKSKGTQHIDGADISPGMLRYAEARGAYSRLEHSDLAATPFVAASYEVCVAALVDEHLPSLDGLYAEAARLAISSGWLIVVGYHPHFMMMSGMAAHFRRATGSNVAIESYVHLFSDHLKAATANGWTLHELRESRIDAEWLEAKPGWGEFVHHPISYLAAWRR